MLSKEEKALLSKKLLQYRVSSTNVIVIITQKTLKDTTTGEVYQLEEAAKHYFNNWGIGLKEKNNGVLFFVIKDDRKIRIATGAGIEGILTNEDCQRIIDENIIPNFKNKAYYKGLDEALDKAMETLSPELFPAKSSFGPVGDTLPPATSQSYSYNTNQTDSESSALPFIILIAIVVIIIAAVVKMVSNNNVDNRVYNSDGAYSSSSYNRRNGWRWFFSGLFFSSFFNNRSSSTSQNNNYHNLNSGSSNNSSFDSGYSNSFGSSDSFSSSSSDSGSSFGGGGSDGGGASGGW